MNKTNQTNNREAWFHTLRENVSVSDKSWGVAVVLSGVLGIFGADRFYLGYPLLGFLKLVTGGFGGILWVSDFLRILSGRMKDTDGRAVKR